MPRLLSGSTLRRGGSGEFLDLKGAMPQLPPTDTTATGFTLITDDKLRTSYRSSLGFIEFTTASMYSALPEGTIRILATGSTFLSTTTTSGNFVVEGGVGIGGNMNIAEDIVVNGITIGRGYEGVNNIVIRGTADIPINNWNNGQENIAIGYDALLGIETSNRNIAIGRYALNSGTDFFGSIAIGDRALQKIGYLHALEVASISNATNTNPVVITANNHGLNSGTQILITNVIGMTELNNQNYYIKKLSNNTLSLYNDLLLSSPADGTGYNAYASGGNVNKVLLRNSNIAFGTNSGKNLIDGEKNFFLGDTVGQNLSTGTANILIGHYIGNNLTEGSGNISLGGDNLVNGLDNQVNIGSIFYYDGQGQLQLNSDTEVGVGTLATATTFIGIIEAATNTMPVTLTVPYHRLVSGEDVFIRNSVGMTEINDTIFWIKRLNDNTIELYNDAGLTIALDGTGFGSYVSSGELHDVKPDGGLVVFGGVAITDNLLVQGSLEITGNNESTTIDNGALVVKGGVGIGKSLNVGKNLTVEGNGNVNLNPSGGDVSIQPVLGGTVNIRPATTIGSIDNIVIGATDPRDATFLNVSITSTATAINTITGALTVAGGVGIQGPVYSATGIEDENYLLYTPKVHITTGTAPLLPRLGDVWIDSSIPAYLQYIKDGTSTFWIQVGTV